MLARFDHGLDMAVSLITMQALGRRAATLTCLIDDNDIACIRDHEMRFPERLYVGWQKLDPTIAKHRGTADFQILAIGRTSQCVG